jgi:hypothetical protein
MGRASEDPWESLPVRLELRDWRWDDERRFSGKYGQWGVEVATFGAGLSIRTRFDPAPPFEKAFPKDAVERFDDVLSHHADFDAVVCVTALEWNRLGTLEVLTREAVRSPLLRIIEAGGLVEGARITTPVSTREVGDASKVVALHDALATALVSPAVPRLESPPPEPTPERPKRLFECDGTFVEELPNGKLHLHVDRRFGTCAEIDGEAIQFHGGGRVALSELRDLILDTYFGSGWGRYEVVLLARSGGQSFQVGVGEDHEMLDLAAFLRGHGFPELTPSDPLGLLGIPPPLPKR